MIIDSHCHLNMKDFTPDLSDIIKNAKNNDINGMLTISTKIEEFKNISNIARNNKNIWYSLGIHPHNVNDNFIFLKSVNATIRLKNYELIEISSDFGKYNIDNYDTIFSKNVIITYLDNIIEGKYLDFSWDKNLMIISKNVTLKNNQSSLRADVIEVDIKKKDIRIFMHEENKKINIKSLN